MEQANLPVAGDITVGLGRLVSSGLCGTTGPVQCIIGSMLFVYVAGLISYNDCIDTMTLSLQKLWTDLKATECYR